MNNDMKKDMMWGTLLHLGNHRLWLAFVVYLAARGAVQSFVMCKKLITEN